MALVAVALVIVAATALVACNDGGQETSTKLKLTFDLNYDGAPEAKTQEIERAEFKDVETPARTGYDFVEWTRDRDGREKINESTALRSGSTVYAQWQKKVYDVRFFVGDVQIGETQKVKFEESASAPPLSEFWNTVKNNHPGKAFDGWNNSFDSVTANLDVSAVLAESTANALFIDGTVTVAEYAGIEGKNVPLPPVVRKDGFDFAGWFTSEQTQYVEGTSKFSAQLTYYAKWEIAELSNVLVTDGNGAEVDEFSAVYGETFSLTAALATEHDGIAYAYEWKLAEQTAGNKTLSPSALDAGTYEYTIVVTASCDGCENKTAQRQFTVVITPAPASISTAQDSLQRTWTGSPFSNFVDAIDAAISTEGFSGDSTLKYTLNGEPFSNATELTDGGVYTIVIELANNKNFSLHAEYPVKIAAARIGSDDLTVEDALARGGDIVLFGNAFVTGNNTLKAGSTLVLPYDGGADPEKLTADGVNVLYYIDSSDEATYLKRKLTVSGDLQILGTLKIGGTMGSNTSRAFQGATLGNYAQLTVDDNCLITVGDGGVLDVYGYVKGDGALEILSGGKALAPFVIRDYRGGNNTVGVYLNNSICPFNQYEFPNIQVEQTVYSGAVFAGHANLFTGSTASGQEDPKYNKADSDIIGGENSLLHLKNGYIKIKNSQTFHAEYPLTEANLHLRYAPVTKIDVYGDMDLGAIMMTLNVPALGDYDIKTSNVTLPVPFNIDLTIKSGTTTVPHKYKLLPGSKVTIDENATVQFANKASLIIYDGDWKDSSARHDRLYPALDTAASLIVKGTLIFKSGSAMGGNIIRQGGHVTFENGVTMSVQAKEGWTSSFLYETTITYDRTYTATVDSATAEAGKTY